MKQHIAATATKPLPIRPVRRALYFAYGSNLNEEQVFRRCPGARCYGPCTLPDYRLVFDGVADIIPARGAAVEGGALRDHRQVRVRAGPLRGVSAPLRENHI